MSKDDLNYLADDIHKQLSELQVQLAVIENAASKIKEIAPQIKTLRNPERYLLQEMNKIEVALKKSYGDTSAEIFDEKHIWGKIFKIRAEIKEIAENL